MGASQAMRHEAWDVAVANQAVAHIDPEVLRKLSAAYALQRETEAATRVSLGLFSGPRLADAMTDLGIGAIDPLEFLHVTRQVALAVRTLQGTLIQLEAALGRALPGEAPAGPPPGPLAEGHR